MEHDIKNVLAFAKDKLSKAQIPGDMTAVFLMEHLLSKKISMLPNYILSDNEYNQFMDLVDRKIAREPLDSIIGYTEFLGIDIPFSKYTLSPRQETEIMVDSIIKEQSGKPNLKVLDMCCGSGCIGLAIAKYLDAEVTLADISDEALREAEQTAKANNIGVKFVNSDMFSNITERYDIIVSNPPYINSSDVLELEPEVKEYDPVLALDGGEDGLDFYRVLCKELPYYLKDGGYIYMEFGIGQAEDIIKMLKPNFENIEVIKDYSGIDRYIKGKKYVK